MSLKKLKKIKFEKESVVNISGNFSQEISEEMIEKLWEKMYQRPAIISCSHCGSHNAFTNPSCIACGAPFRDIGIEDTYDNRRNRHKDQKTQSLGQVYK